jgi:DNA end-binding protein Ku
MWKGAILFGLVSIPVGLYPATEEKSVRFHQLHKDDMARIRYRKVCSLDEEEVDNDEIVRGYEYRKNEYVVVTDDELDALPVESSRAIDIAQFVDIQEIDPVYFQKSYYLAPTGPATKPYHLLAQVLEDEQRVAVAKIALRDKEHLAVIRARDGLLLLETMFWPDEIREPAFEELDKKVSIREQELTMAKSLIANLTEPWDPTAYQDEYREALLELIDKKAAGETVEVAPREQPAKVIDLMEALKASVEASAKRGAGEEAAAEGNGRAATGTDWRPAESAPKRRRARR